MPAVLKQKELAYWAGFMDGEGCIRISLCQSKNCSRPQAQLVIAATNTHVGVIQKLYEVFPTPKSSKMTNYLGGPKYQINRRPQYKWALTGMSAYKVIKLLYPFLIVKKEQAKLAMEFYELPWRSRRSSPGGGWKIRSEEAITIDLEYYRRIKE